MTTAPKSEQHPQEIATAIVSIALRVLRTRDKIDISSDLIEERARNIVTALGSEFDLVPKGHPVADVRAGRPNQIVSMVSEYLAIRREAQEISDRLDAMTVSEAAVMVASLLADPFDRAGRIEARLWLQAWRTAQAARCSTSTTNSAAVGS
jgi:hypothetical protein